MNEATLMLFLKKLYDAMQILEELIKEAFESYNKEDFEIAFSLKEYYDELFEWTNKIEDFFGIIEE